MTRTRVDRVRPNALQGTRRDATAKKRSLLAEQRLERLDGVGVDERLVELVHELGEFGLLLHEFQARVGANLAVVDPTRGHASLEREQGFIRLAELGEAARDVVLSDLVDLRRLGKIVTHVVLRFQRRDFLKDD